MQRLVLWPHSKEILGRNPGQDISVRSVLTVVLTQVSSHIPKICKSGVRLIGRSKLPVGVNVSVDCCLSLYVSPSMKWQ